MFEDHRIFSVFILYLFNALIGDLHFSLEGSLQFHLVKKSNKNKNFRKFLYHFFNGENRGNQRWLYLENHIRQELDFSCIQNFVIDLLSIIFFGISTKITFLPNIEVTQTLSTTEAKTKKIDELDTISKFRLLILLQF